MPIMTTPIFPPQAPGSRPKGARSEREASAHVRNMFSRIAPRYDFLNHLLSLSLDRVWRRRAASKFQKVLRRTNARVLDLCCGTGDLTFAMERVRLKAWRDRGAYRIPMVGSDFAQPMLERAHEKGRKHHRAAVFVASDALRLPFPDACFDLVTTAFGFRNLANYESGLREIARVLKEDGQVGILEFSEPKGGPMAVMFRLYFRHILPNIGGIISGSKDAYTYLPGSVAKFPSRTELAEMMKKVGFVDVKVFVWNFGSVVLHSARMPEQNSENGNN
ncbi:MAG: bifunctional demethylmenaquinone methyltransferase/2-methoxy-6-polyprenyl-1,4-benzoquinol methylase UbiE [Candidatus Acidiferrales bacterium]|jgi:demethylmenaquinone methyltransferase/2-methoxy-6-polyprenyl-1,4-benzoquinol methylase